MTKLLLALAIAGVGGAIGSDAGANIMHVPYKGNADAINALLTGDVTMAEARRRAIPAPKR